MCTSGMSGESDSAEAGVNDLQLRGEFCTSLTSPTPRAFHLFVLFKAGGVGYPNFPLSTKCVCVGGGGAEERGGGGMIEAPFPLSPCHDGAKIKGNPHSSACGPGKAIVLMAMELTCQARLASGRHLYMIPLDHCWPSTPQIQTPRPWQQMGLATKGMDVSCEISRKEGMKAEACLQIQPARTPRKRSQASGRRSRAG